MNRKNVRIINIIFACSFGSLSILAGRANAQENHLMPNQTNKFSIESTRFNDNIKQRNHGCLKALEERKINDSAIVNDTTKISETKTSELNINDRVVLPTEVSSLFTTIEPGNGQTLDFKSMVTEFLSGQSSMLIGVDNHKERTP